jgi:hypothetical protein
MKIWRFENLEIWKYGEFGRGGFQTRPGNLKIWRFENMGNLGTGELGKMAPEELDMGRNGDSVTKGIP